MITRATVEAVLERLGFSAAPEADLDGLERVYAAWCQTVPFDNLVKRIHLAAGDPTPFPNADPQWFFDSFLAHGTGGTCWPSSLALFSLLDALGFDARLASAAMGDGGGGGGNPEHNHGTIIVRVGGAQYWVDSSMLTDHLLPIVSETPTAIEHPLRPVHAEPVGERWRVWWIPAAMTDALGCLLLDDNVTVEHYHARYEASRDLSRFNTQIFATTNRADRVVSIALGRRWVVDATGTHSAPLDDDRARILVDDFGYSEEIVGRVPPDEPR